MPHGAIEIRFASMHGVRVDEPGANAPPRRGEATAAEGGIRWGWVGGMKSSRVGQKLANSVVEFEFHLVPGLL